MMNVCALRPIARRMILAGLVPAVAACAASHRNSLSEADEQSITSCKAPAATSSWAWKPASLNGVRLEIPEPFVERLTVDTRSRAWVYGPRQIRLTLTTDPHVERNVPNFSGRCEIELGDRSVEVVRSTTAENDRVLTARVPNVEGGFDLVIVVSTRYPKELDALRKVITSVTVAETAGR